jgi:hypothetical protein
MFFGSAHDENHRRTWSTAVAVAIGGAPAHGALGQPASGTCGHAIDADDIGVVTSSHGPEAGYG